jgi:hypothetical protein
MSDYLKQFYDFDRYCDIMDEFCNKLIQSDGEQYSAKSDLKLSIADLRNSIVMCRKAFNDTE